MRIDLLAVQFAYLAGLSTAQAPDAALTRHWSNLNTIAPMALPEHSTYRMQFTYRHLDVVERRRMAAGLSATVSECRGMLTVGL